MVHSVAVETFRCYRDGFHICAVCKAETVLPEAYFGLVIKLVYILGGVVIGLISPILPFPNAVFAALLMIAFHHIVSAFAFHSDKYVLMDCDPYTLNMLEACIDWTIPDIRPKQLNL